MLHALHEGADGNRTQFYYTVQRDLPVSKLRDNEIVCTDPSRRELNQKECVAWTVGTWAKSPASSDRQQLEAARRALSGPVDIRYLCLHDPVGLDIKRFVEDRPPKLAVIPTPFATSSFRDEGYYEVQWSPRKFSLPEMQLQSRESKLDVADGFRRARPAALVLSYDGGEPHRERLLLETHYLHQGMVVARVSAGPTQITIVVHEELGDRLEAVAREYPREITILPRPQQGPQLPPGYGSTEQDVRGDDAGSLYATLKSLVGASAALAGAYVLTNILMRRLDVSGFLYGQVTRQMNPPPPTRETKQVVEAETEPGKIKPKIEPRVGSKVEPKNDVPISSATPPLITRTITPEEIQLDVADALAPSNSDHREELLRDAGQDVAFALAEGRICVAAAALTALFQQSKYRQIRWNLAWLGVDHDVVQQRIAQAADARPQDREIARWKSRLDSTQLLANLYGGGGVPMDEPRGIGMQGPAESKKERRDKTEGRPMPKRTPPAAVPLAQCRSLGAAQSFARILLKHGLAFKRDKSKVETYVPMDPKGDSCHLHIGDTFISFKTKRGHHYTLIKGELANPEAMAAARFVLNPELVHDLPIWLMLDFMEGGDPATIVKRIKQASRDNKGDNG
jgi:hypothetical protein